MSAVETGQMSAAETGQMSAVKTRQMLASQIRGLASKQQWGLPYPQVGLVKSPGCHSDRKKSACGKQPSSYRACQAADKGWPKIQRQAKSKSWLTKVLVRAKNIKFGPKWVENRRLGLKFGPNQS